MLKYLLAHPLTRGIDIDSPETTLLRASIIRGKPFLKKIYEEWYTMLCAALPAASPGAILEIGSGAGFLSDFLPDAITTECFFVPSVDAVLDAQHLPFHSSVLKAVFVTNVLHHVPRPGWFIKEAARCVRPGGIMAMIEPWVTPWSSFVYRRLHHEPFDSGAEEWRFPSTGPLSGANGAMPWIIFQRDRQRFCHEFPEWRIEEITPFMPFRYLLSGGVSLRSLMWKRTFPMWRSLENLLAPCMDFLAMFARIILWRSS